METKVRARRESNPQPSASKADDPRSNPDNWHNALAALGVGVVEPGRWYERQVTLGEALGGLLACGMSLDKASRLVDLIDIGLGRVDAGGVVGAAARGSR